MQDTVDLANSFGRLLSEPKASSSQSQKASRSKRKRRKKPISSVTESASHETVDELVDDAAPPFTSWSQMDTNRWFEIYHRGFRNYKNCCYLNVCLQTLVHIPPVRSLFCQLDKTLLSTTQPTKLLCTAVLDLFKQFNVLTETVSASDSSIAPNPEHSTIVPYDLGPPIDPDVRFMRLLGLDSGMQEDVAECLTRMLTLLHEELGNPTDTNHATDVNGQLDESSEWIVTDRSGKRRPEARRTELQGGQSRIAELFSGVLISNSTVKHGPKGRLPFGTSTTASIDVTSRKATCISTKEPFFILPLEINANEVDSIDAALNHLTGSESIEDYRDAQTGLSSTVNRRISIDRLPPYLCLQLKRFVCGSKTNSEWSVEKSLKLVHIDPEIQIPTKLLSREKIFTKDERCYQLYAVIFHVGQTPVSGHYTVAIRCSANLHGQSFIYIDDTNACILPDSKATHNLLLNTHRPLDVRNCVFNPLPRQQSTANNIQPLISKQPRTPYIVVYQVATDST